MDVKSKVLITVAILGFCAWLLHPTVRWYGMSEDEREELDEEEVINLQKGIINLGLDLQGGMDVLLEVDVKKRPEGMPKRQAVEQSKDIIVKRVDQLGLSETLVVREGEQWIRVQLPGVKDTKRALELIGKTAMLEFKIVEDTPELVSRALSGDIPSGLEVLPGTEEEKIVVQSTALLTGGDLKPTARVDFGGQFGEPHVSIEFTRVGARKFARVTERNIGRQLAIILDGVVQSAPVIQTAIPDGRAIITHRGGNIQDASDTAIILRAGALPVPVDVIQTTIVGPTLGIDSIKKGILACIVGGLAVIIFMGMYYKLSGLIADIGLVVNIIILLASLAMLGATLTLPGIAGIILTIGISVDANVLIFERIREELTRGLSIKQAIKTGYNKAFLTICDSNITTLVGAAIIYMFGGGQIQGFAITLGLGVLINLYTAVVVTKTMFEMRKEYKVLSI
ncbi:protein translocase subunit SecD [bacterium Unc6]|nr:protein translocase subunit SecD [bacterium Unc6]